MACTKEELRQRVESAEVDSNGKQFTAELRRDILEYSREQQAAGKSQQSIAAELGMKGWTLNRWHQNERKAKADVAGFVEVAPSRRSRGARVTSAKEAYEPFEVTCPSGFEIRVPSRFETRAFRELLGALEG